MPGVLDEQRATRQGFGSIGAATFLFQAGRGPLGASDLRQIHPHGFGPHVTARRPKSFSSKLSTQHLPCRILPTPLNRCAKNGLMMDWAVP